MVIESTVSYCRECGRPALYKCTDCRMKLCIDCKDEHKCKKAEKVEDKQQANLSETDNKVIERAPVTKPVNVVKRKR